MVDVGSFPGGIERNQVLHLDAEEVSTVDPYRFVPLAILCLTPLACGHGKGPDEDAQIRVDAAQRSVSFRGRIYPSRFNAWYTRPKNHHFIVWKKGRAARNGLIRADVSDVEILHALERLGARPGNNLTVDTWERRDDARSTAPDLRVQGTRVEIQLEWGTAHSLRVEDYLIDRQGSGFLFRVGGHKALVPVWKSGCVVCLQSCPGGRVSNERHTMRDLARGTSRFELRRDRLPNDGTAVRVTLRLLDS